MSNIEVLTEDALTAQVTPLQTRLTALETKNLNTRLTAAETTLTGVPATIDGKIKTAFGGFVVTGVNNGGYIEPVLANPDSGQSAALRIGNGNGVLRVLPYPDGTTYIQTTQNALSFTGLNGAPASTLTFGANDTTFSGAVRGGSAPGTVDALTRKDYVDGLVTSFGRDLGSGATWPTTGPGGSALRRGDAYYHTAVAQLGVYTGAGFRLNGPGTVATTAARDALSWAYAGLVVHVTAGLTRWEMQPNLTWFQTNQNWVDTMVASTNYSVTHAAGTGNTNLPSFDNLTVTVPSGRRLEVRWIMPAVLQNAATNGGVVLVVNAVTQDAHTISTSTGTGFNSHVTMTGSYTNTTTADVTIAITVYGYCTSGSIQYMAHSAMGPRLRTKIS